MPAVWAGLVPLWPTETGLLGKCNFFNGRLVDNSRCISVCSLVFNLKLIVTFRTFRTDTSPVSSENWFILIRPRRGLNLDLWVRKMACYQLSQPHLRKTSLVRCINEIKVQRLASLKLR